MGDEEATSQKERLVTRGQEKGVRRGGSKEVLLMSTKLLANMFQQSRARSTIINNYYIFPNSSNFEYF